MCSQAPSNPALPPDLVILKLTPGHDLRGLGKHGFKLHQLNRVFGYRRLNHSADQEVLLFGDGGHSRPFGQQQLFGVQWIQVDQPRISVDVRL